MFLFGFDSKNNKKCFDVVYKRFDVVHKCFVYKCFDVVYKRKIKGGCKRIKKFIKLHEPRVFDETFNAFEMNHNFEKK